MNDQGFWYTEVHKLVGSSAYAGAMRVHYLSDRMQRHVPKVPLDDMQPDFQRYRDLFVILEKEANNCFNEFTALKEKTGWKPKEGKRLKS